VKTPQTIHTSPGPAQNPHTPTQPTAAATTQPKPRSNSHYGTEFFFLRIPWKSIRFGPKKRQKRQTDVFSPAKGLNAIFHTMRPKRRIFTKSTSFGIACAFFIPARALVCVCERVRLCGVVGLGSGLIFLALPDFVLLVHKQIFPPRNSGVANTSPPPGGGGCWRQENFWEFDTVGFWGLPDS
jgi:hypothetical protein